MLGKASSVEKWDIEKFNSATCPLDGQFLVWTEDGTDLVASHCYFTYYATLSPDNDYNVVIVTDFELKRQLEAASQVPEEEPPPPPP